MNNLMQLKIKRTQETVDVYETDNEGCVVWIKSSNSFQRMAWKLLVPVDFDFRTLVAKKHIEAKAAPNVPTVYITSDGITFANYESAIKHQVELDIAKEQNGIDIT